MANQAVSLFYEIKLFLRFIRSPNPGKRLSGRFAGNNIVSDFYVNISIKRLLQWALLLWLVNLFVFAPMALVAVEASGAQHRLDIHDLPYLTALIWAPIVEELCFRYVLRRPAMLWWFAPLMVAVLVQGPGFSQGMLLILAVLLALAPIYCTSKKLGFAYRFTWQHRLQVINLYPLFFHLVAILFAAVHLFNFKFASLPIFLLPLLVIPQWVTGLVLGWLRVTRGIGSSIALHAVFNGGPLFFIWLLLQLAPDVALG